MNRDRLNNQEAKTVRKHKKRNVKAYAKADAKFAVNQLYDGTPMRNASIAKILNIK